MRLLYNLLTLVVLVGVPPLKNVLNVDAEASNLVYDFQNDQLEHKLLLVFLLLQKQVWL